ncbi:acyl-CoA dehydrogenase family protein [Dehalococcoidia bacterium]|nr:acyl-CoA dehydrogenase family protein [Dehalococcoidia bacterium]
MQPIFSAEDDAFREEVRAFYRRELPKDWLGAWLDESEASSQITANIRRKLANKGWLTMAWPKEYGGQEAPLTRQVVFAEESAYYRVNARDAGTGFLGVAIMQHGTAEQKERFLGPISKGEVDFHQGFSEPNAGSDLTGLTTKATRDGDNYVISGQKIWGGHLEQSSYSCLLARTDESAPKHKGISFFVIPADTPGLHADTFENMGGGHQQIVYYDNCRVDAQASLIGEENQGWYIAATALNHERAFVEYASMGKRMLEEIVELWRLAGRMNTNNHQTVLLRSRLAQIAIEIKVCQLLNYRFVWLHGQGRDPSYEASEVKVFGSEMTQRLMQISGQVLGLYSQIQRATANDNLVRLGGRVEQQLRYSIAFTIMGGTSEVQRNLIAGRGLGLPR